MVERGSTTFTSPPASSKAAPTERAPESGALAHSLVFFGEARSQHRLLAFNHLLRTDTGLFSASCSHPKSPPGDLPPKLDIPTLHNASFWFYAKNGAPSGS